MQVTTNLPMRSVVQPWANRIELRFGKAYPVALGIDRAALAGLIEAGRRELDEALRRGVEMIEFAQISAFVQVTGELPMHRVGAGLSVARGRAVEPKQSGPPPRRPHPASGTQEQDAALRSLWRRLLGRRATTERPTGRSGCGDSGAAGAGRWPGC